MIEVMILELCSLLCSKLFLSLFLQLHGIHPGLDVMGLLVNVAFGCVHEGLAARRALEYLLFHPLQPLVLDPDMVRQVVLHVEAFAARLALERSLSYVNAQMPLHVLLLDEGPVAPRALERFRSRQLCLKVISIPVGRSNIGRHGASPQMVV